MNQHSNPNSPAFFVDNAPFPWPNSTITGDEIRKVAAVPDNVDLFRKVPGHADQLIEQTTVVTLGEPKPHFSTQAVGSKGG